MAVEDTGIRFTHKAGNESGKFAYIPDKASQSWFLSQMSSHLMLAEERIREICQ